MAGVLWRNNGGSGQFAYSAKLDAISCDVLEALLEPLPHDQPGLFCVQNPCLQSYMRDTLRVRIQRTELRLTAAAEGLVRDGMNHTADDVRVRRVDHNDLPLFAGAQGWAKERLQRGAESGSVYAAVWHGQVVSSGRLPATGG